MSSLDFSTSKALTLGVELELQIVSRRDCDLTRGASELIKLLTRSKHPGDIKPEITESMLEISTGVHERHTDLLIELGEIRDAVVAAADKLNLLITGGGAHPFQHWSERSIYDHARFRHVSQIYGYLAKQFTIFGQHIHVGCINGDDALYLLHALSRYLPHFIALAASSPYYQGVDTAFDSSRLNSVYAFPLSGRAPFVQSWNDFVAYFDKMRAFGIVTSMKDFYWDIRPKPEFGTIEIRVCDTPLTVERASMLAAYAQLLCRHLLQERVYPLSEEMYYVYNYNRFQACRFGLGGELIDPISLDRKPIAEDILNTLPLLAPHARELDAASVPALIHKTVYGRGTDAIWMREQYSKNRSLEELVWQQALLWRGELQR